MSARKSKSNPPAARDAGSPAGRSRDEGDPQRLRFDRGDERGGRTGDLRARTASNEEFPRERVEQAGQTGGERADVDVTADDLSPETLLDSDASRTPSARQGRTAADRELSVTDEPLGLGGGLDEAEDADREPVGRAEAAKLRRKSREHASDPNYFEPNEAAVQAELTRIYAQRGRVIAAFLFNLAAWTASGVSAWFVLELMGSDIALWKVLSLEGVIFALRSMAFVIPGAIGVQEAAYVLVAPLFGLAPEAALALSLAKRARDLVIGALALLVWQINESRGLMAGR